MIRLLNGRSLAVKDLFRAEKFALTLSERQSTATITVGPDAPEISVGDWLQDEDEPGAGIVWRVKAIDTAYESETRTLSCEHIINTLRDMIMFGETKPGTMAGNGKSANCTAEQAVRYILGRQTDWALGTFGFTKSAPYNFNGDSLFDALGTVSSSLYDAVWSYDMSRYPFLLSINPGSTTPACEMRMDRNIRTLKKTVDRSRMYTRFYPIGKNNKHISGDYVSRNENLYGTVCKVETDNSMDTEEKLRAWAEEKLNNHAEPLVTVTVSGMDLSAATGEALDRLVLCTVCRVPLPEFSAMITERITKLSWSDKSADPMSVTVTLANQIEDVASIVNSIQKSGGGGGRAAAKNAEEDHAWMVDTTTHVGMVAEAVAGEGAAQDWSRVASVMVDGEGIHQRVKKTEGDIVTAYTLIDSTDEKITLEAAARQQGDNALSSSIQVTAGQIRSEVKNTETKLNSSITQTADKIMTQVNNGDANLSSAITQTADMIIAQVNDGDAKLSSSIQQTKDQILTQVKNEDDKLQSAIDQQADKIALVVTDDGKVDVASIVAGINGQTGSYVKINAKTINLTGYVTMTSFNALDGKVDGVLAAGTFGANRITSGTINSTGTLAASGNFNYKGHRIGVYACETTSGNTFYALGYT